MGEADPLLRGPSKSTLGGRPPDGSPGRGAGDGGVRCLEVDLHALHRVAGCTGRFIVPVARPPRWRRDPLRIPVDVTGSKTSGRCRVAGAPDGYPVCVHDLSVLNHPQLAIGETDL